MVVVVSQAMILPVTNHKNGCTATGNFDNTIRDLCLKSVAAMERKAKGGIENDVDGGHSIIIWPRAASDGSISSMDSLPGGETITSPELRPSVLHKMSAGLQIRESECLGLSDDESMLDTANEELSIGKPKRSLGGAPVAYSTTGLSMDEATQDHGSTVTDDFASTRVKFMCSFGGKILPRPLDGKLRYVGGETRLIAVHRDTSYSELMTKFTEIYDQVLTIKYKLPDEDLDALVSVSSDEDLENMMEEYDKLEASDVSSRLRVFLSSSALDYDSTFHIDFTGDLRNSEQRYVDAVNGIPESSSRKLPVEGLGLVATQHSENLIGLEVNDAWTMQRGQENVVPVAVLAPQGMTQDVPMAHHHHHHHVPVAQPVTSSMGRSNIPSAPSSAPSSPPLLPRAPGVVKPQLLSDHHVQYFQDTLQLGGGQQYNVFSSDSSFQDNENYGSSAASSGNSQHELYRSSESRRGVESPPKKQIEMNHQEHALRVDQQRRLADSKMNRVGSHPKLTRLAEHHEMPVSSRPDPQVMSEVLLSQVPQVDLQRLLHQQQTTTMQQPAWQHQLDSQSDLYRRKDVIGRNAGPGQEQQVYQQQPTQQPPLVFRTGLNQLAPGHEATVYRQAEQPQQQMQQFPDDVPFLHRSVSSHAIGPPGSAVQPSYHVGSAPSSPRLGYRDIPSRHLAPPQQLPMQWTVNGSSFVEQHGRRLHNYGDQSNRSYRPSNSPPRHRELPQDYLNAVEDRMIRQQQQALGNFDSLIIDQAQYAELLSRSQLPQYKGSNPFQEKGKNYQDHQDAADSRRMNVQQGIDGQLHSGQHFLPLHNNQRMDFQDSLLQPPEQMAIHHPYQDSRETVTDWVLQQQRRHDGDEGRTRKGGRVARTGQPEYLEEEKSLELGSSHLKEAQKLNYAGLHLPETSDDLLVSSLIDPYAGCYRRGDRHEVPGDGSFQFRAGIPQSSGLSAGYSQFSLGAMTDTAQLPPYANRQAEIDYISLASIPRPDVSVKDSRATSAFHEHGGGGNQHVLTSCCASPQLGPVSQRMEERPLSGAFTQLQSQSPFHIGNVKMGNSEALFGNTDLCWSGSVATLEGRMDNATQPSRERLGIHDDRLRNFPISVGGKVRLSRPSSSTNIASLEEDTLRKTSYGIQDGVGSLLDNDPLPTSRPMQAFNNPLYITAPASAVAEPCSVIDISPMSSALINHDVNVGGSKFQDYSHRAPGTQVLPEVAAYENHEPKRPSDHSKVTDLCLPNTEDALPGQLTLTQHLAEDMASAVLESTYPVQEPLHLETKFDSFHENTVGDFGLERKEIWPVLEPSPTLSVNIWSNFLDDSGLPEGQSVAVGPVYDKSTAEDTPGTAELRTADGQGLETVRAMSQELPQVETDKKKEEDKDNVAEVNGSDSAAEAIARGLQTIKNADLEELRELGSGTFGTVYHGKWKGTDVAIKRIKASCFAGRPSEQERLIADFWREACNLGHLHHPNVVAFYGVVADGPGGTLATVTEYMVNGSLKQVLQKKDRTIDRRKRLLIAMDAGFGMEYLHGKNIVHFDLKCENLLVNMRDPHRPICKVGDLGLSKVKHQTMVSGGVRGTLPWMAPELLNDNSSMVTEKVDIFSFGIVMWELLTGEEPYANMHYGAIIGGIVNNTLRPPIPSWCDPSWRSLMERCWAAEPASRPSFSEIASELRVMAGAVQSKAHGQNQGQQLPPS